MVCLFVCCCFLKHFVYVVSNNEHKNIEPSNINRGILDQRGSTTESKGMFTRAPGPKPDSNLDHNPHGRGGLSLDLNPVCLRVNATNQSGSGSESSCIMGPGLIVVGIISYI